MIKKGSRVFKLHDFGNFEKEYFTCMYFGIIHNNYPYRKTRITDFLVCNTDLVPKIRFVVDRLLPSNT